MRFHNGLKLVKCIQVAGRRPSLEPGLRSRLLPRLIRMTGKTNFGGPAKRGMSSTSAADLENPRTARRTDTCNRLDALDQYCTADIPPDAWEANAMS